MKNDAISDYFFELDDIIPSLLKVSFESKPIILKNILRYSETHSLLHEIPEGLIVIATWTFIRDKLDGGNDLEIIEQFDELEFGFKGIEPLNVYPNHLFDYLKIRINKHYIIKTNNTYFMKIGGVYDGVLSWEECYIDYNDQLLKRMVKIIIDDMKKKIFDFHLTDELKKYFFKD
jgi:hypothetical protein